MLSGIFLFRDSFKNFHPHYSCLWFFASEKCLASESKDKDFRKNPWDEEEEEKKTGRRTHKSSFSQIFHFLNFISLSLYFATCTRNPWSFSVWWWRWIFSIRGRDLSLRNTLSETTGYEGRKGVESKLPEIIKQKRMMKVKSSELIFLWVVLLRKKLKNIFSRERNHKEMEQDYQGVSLILQV